MDQSIAARRIQSVWRKWIKVKREWDALDEAEAHFEIEYHNFHCGGY